MEIETFSTMNSFSKKTAFRALQLWREKNRELYIQWKGRFVLFAFSATNKDTEQVMAEMDEIITPTGKLGYSL